MRRFINMIDRRLRMTPAPADKQSAGRSKKTLATVVGVAAAALLYQIVPEFEGGVDADGTSVGYVDPVGVPTKCHGDTSNVIVGHRYTAAECRESLDRQLIAHAEPVMQCTPQLQVCTIAGSQCYTQIAAFVDFAYNVGVSAYCGSSVARAVRAQEWAIACERINEKPSGAPQWVYAGGRVLPGLVKRRTVERDLCEQGRPS